MDKLVKIFLCIGYIFIPFISASGQTSQLPLLCVEGIMYDDQLPLAIVNGAVVAEGDEIEGASVVKIDRLSVQFEFEGSSFARGIREGCRGLLQPWRRTGQSIRQGTQPGYIPGGRGGKWEGLLFQYVGTLTAIILPLILALYVYAAITLQFIACKTGTENGWLAWIPIANLYLMCMIADKPAWWMFLCFIPYANIIFIAILWMGIADARHKPAWLGLLILLPIVNLIIVGYLAFSR
jgi:hypothetical protein